MLEPTGEDMKGLVRQKYDQLRKGRGRQRLDDWLNQWIALSAQLEQLQIDNLSPHQLCMSFIETVKEINPVFYSQQKGRPQYDQERFKLANRIDSIFEKITQGLETRDTAIRILAQ